MKTIQSDNYQIHIGNDADFWECFNAFVSAEKFSRKLIVVDENTSVHCLPLLLAKTEAASWPVIAIKSGEQNKNLATCEQIWAQMMDLQLDRKSLVINLGGGVIGDMSGFCAATFKRGIYFLQMPTTLLSQVDASIGGKLGVDFKTIKNSIGVFKNPEAVFTCPDFLQTLPFAELRSGYSEIIKHALIGAEVLWADLQQLDINTLNSKEVPLPQTPDWDDLIYRSLMVKQTVVAQDPFETGLRKILNFGHTIGHALESHALESPEPLLHGEAIAIGMICESWIAFAQKQLLEQDFKAFYSLLLKQIPSKKISEEAIPELIALMQQDKKNENGLINFTFVPKAGKANFNQNAPIPLIAESLHRYNTLLS
jgi:3-dehydroquinate synthase